MIVFHSRMHLEEVAATEETPAQPVRQWIRFAANLTVGEAMELKNFFSTHGIVWKLRRVVTPCSRH